MIGAPDLLGRLFPLLTEHLELYHHRVLRKQQPTEKAILTSLKASIKDTNFVEDNRAVSPINYQAVPYCISSLIAPFSQDVEEASEDNCPVPVNFEYAPSFSVLTRNEALNSAQE